MADTSTGPLGMLAALALAVAAAMLPQKAVPYLKAAPPAEESRLNPQEKLERALAKFAPGLAQARAASAAERLPVENSGALMEEEKEILGDLRELSEQGSAETRQLLAKVSQGGSLSEQERLLLERMQPRSETVTTPVMRFLLKSSKKSGEASESRNSLAPLGEEASHEAGGAGGAKASWKEKLVSVYAGSREAVHRALWWGPPALLALFALALLLGAEGLGSRGASLCHQSAWLWLVLLSLYGAERYLTQGRFIWSEWPAVFWQAPLLALVLGAFVLRLADSRDRWKGVLAASLAPLLSCAVALLWSHVSRRPGI